jgi:HEAT repeat protein
MMPTVIETVEYYLQGHSASSIADSLCSLAYHHPDEAVRLVRQISKALPEARIGEQVDLSIALRHLGPSAVDATRELRQLMGSHSIIVEIHAASALARIHPNDSQGSDFLFKCLADEAAIVRWISAYAVARSDISQDRFKSRLRELLEDEDVRVRVTSADALWQMKVEPDVIIPVLVSALSDDHQPLTTEFIYPSNFGLTHRVFALRTLGDMGPAARAAIPHILRQIEDAADDETKNDDSAFAGYAALSSLTKMAPLDSHVVKRISDLRGRKGFVRMFPTHIEELIKRIESVQ